MGEVREGVLMGGAHTDPLFPTVQQGRYCWAQYTDEDAELGEVVYPKYLE